MRCAPYAAQFLCVAFIVGCQQTSPPRDEPNTPPQAAAAVAAPQPRVLLIGADGLTFDVLLPLIEAGKLPQFKKLLNEGQHGILQSEWPMRSPALWTTVATGQSRQEHGIHDFVTGSNFWPKAERNKPRRLVTSDMRRSPALWDFATQANVSSLVVGWLNTWPAQKVNGVMVAPYMALGEKRQTSIKGRIYKDAQGQTYPEEAFAALRPLVIAADALTEPELQPVIGPDIDGVDPMLHAAIPRLKRYRYTIRWSIASARTNVGLVEHFLKASPEHRLIMTYFDGSDTLAHRFWLFRQSLKDIRARLKAHGLDPTLAAPLKARFGEIIDGYYVFLDGLLARLRQAVGPNAIVVVVSDHGWGPLKAARAPHDHVPFDGEHRMEGVILAQGPGIEPGKVDKATLYDVAPSVLQLLQLDVPEALPGKTLFGKAQRREWPSAAHFENDDKGSNAQEEAFQAAEMERLRSLGYVQ